MHPCGLSHVHEKQRPWWHVARTAAVCVYVGGVSLSRATVVVYNQNATKAAHVEIRFDDIPAVEGFGPRIPDQVSASHRRGTNKDGKKSKVY